MVVQIIETFWTVLREKEGKITAWPGPILDQSIHSQPRETWLECGLRRKWVYVNGGVKGGKDGERVSREALRISQRDA